MRELISRVVVIITDDAHGMGAVNYLEGVLGPIIAVDVARVTRLAG